MNPHNLWMMGAALWTAGICLALAVGYIAGLVDGLVEGKKRRSSRLESEQKVVYAVIRGDDYDRLKNGLNWVEPPGWVLDTPKEVDGVLKKMGIE